MKERKSMFFKAAAAVIAFSMLIPASAFADETSAGVGFETEQAGAVETEMTATDELIKETGIQDQADETESSSEVTDDSENEQTQEMQDFEESISAGENEEITQDLTSDDNDQNEFDETAAIDELSSVEDEIDMTTDGWKYAGEFTYYVKNGTLVKNEIINDDGSLYYLSDDGTLITGAWQFQDKSGQYVCIRAYDNGQLATGWYEEESDGGSIWKYYYGTDGKAVSGVQTIDGVTYYFYYNGLMAADNIAEEDGVLYFIGADGTLSDWIDITTDGWKYSGENWYYVKNRELVQDKIINYKGKLYYVDYVGVMIQSTVYLIWDNESEKYVYIRAYDNGQLATGWHKVDFNSDQRDVLWYYYGSDGKSVSGIQTIGGVTYYFYKNGCMAQNTTYTDTEKGILYFFGRNGALSGQIDITTDGWKYTGENWYYVRNGALVKDEIINYNGKLYYLNYYGVMIKGKRDCNWDRSIYFRAYDNGQLATGWDKEGNYWYYYGSDGKAVSGVQTVNGKTYYFSYRGEMLTNTTVEEEGILYVIGDDGVLSGRIDMTTDGWKSAGDDWYYVKNGALVKDEIINYNGELYCLDYNGVMIKGTTYSYWDSESEQSVYIRAYDNGQLVTGWYREYNSCDWMYFNADGSTAEGLMTINGKDYFLIGGSLVYDREFNYNGKIYKSDVNGLCTEITANGSYGSFNKFLLENGALAIGWRLVSGKWYYYDSDGYVTGLQAIDDKYYYFNSEGEMLKGWIKTGSSFYLYAENSGALKTDGWLKLGDIWYYFNDNYMVTGLEQIDGSWNLFGSSGAWQKKLDSNSSGWIYDGQYYYYLSDGQMISGGTRTVNGNIYGFDHSGRMLNDEYTYGYYFGTNGAAVKNSWAKISATCWIYADENGKPVDGWKYINGSWYYFEDNMVVNYDKVIDGKLYKFDEKSYRMVTNGTSVSDGWLMVDGKWYYFENGEACTGIKKIGSATYYLDPYMMTDQIYYGYDSASSRYFDTNGKQLESGWSSDGTIYATGNGKLADGLLSINGKEYYFSYGYLQYDAIVSDDSTVIYETDETGAITDTVKASGTRWYKSSNGSWYYFINGKAAEGLHSIDGKLYYFGPYMVTDQWTGNGYAGSNGVISSTQFIDDRYMDKGTYASGAVTYNGKFYYFCSDGSYYGESAGIFNYRGVVDINGTYYFYDGEGSRTVMTLTNGWNKVDGKYYYRENGKLVTGDSKCINGKYYWFNVNGQLVTDSFMYDRGHYVYVDSNGYITTGWKKIDGTWYYFGSDGHLYIGTHVIDGVSYTFIAPLVYSDYAFVLS